MNNTRPDAPVYMGLPSEKLLLPRFRIAVLLCVPLMLLSMGDMVPGLGHLAHQSWNGWAQGALATPVFLWCGWHFLRRWWVSVRERDTNMFTLIITGTGSAWLYSWAALLLGAHFPASLRGPHGVPLYFETCAVTTAIVLLGQILEQRAQSRTEQALRSLLELAPTRARRLRTDGVEEDVSVDQIQVGDLLRLRPGEAVPVDGVVTEGASEIVESMLSGEPLPVAKQESDPVYAGTINTTGALVLRATRIGADTQLAQIIRLVEEAQESEAPVQGLADRIAVWFVPVVAGIAALTALCWLLLGPEPRVLHALVSAMAVLVVSCPCTLGLATPVAVVTGVGRGAREGVLFKTAEALERLAQTKVLFLDKTGTLTVGRPCVASTRPAAGRSAEEVLGLAAAVEAHSEHPLAHAILEEARQLGVSWTPCSDFSARPGVGVQGIVQGSLVEVVRAESEQESEDSQGHTIVEVRVDGTSRGQLWLEDKLRAHALEAVRRLQSMGTRLIVLSGDRRAAVARVASNLGIDEYHARLSPADKQGLVQAARNSGLKVAFAGDGINDAPALAAADVGIAMGTGAGIAKATAGVILPGADLGALTRAYALSRHAMRVIRQNLFWAFLYNTLCIPLAAGLFYPLLGWQLNPMVAGAAMCLSSLCVVTNALRLHRLSLA